jgi:Holliday junction resolvasome RuvABC endonuclease subunit
MIKKILGIDVSSTTTGICVLLLNEETKEISFDSVTYLKPSHDGNILDRLEDTRIKMKKIIEDINPDYIAIEDIITFLRKKSSANTIITLAVFNRMIGILAYQQIGRAPELYNVLSIRHGLKLTPKFPEKEEMPEIVASHLGIKFPWEFNKKGNPKVESYDKADAMAVALFHAFCLVGRCKVKLPTKNSKKKKTKVKPVAKKKTIKAKNKKK